MMVNAHAAMELLLLNVKPTIANESIDDVVEDLSRQHCTYKELWGVY